jgi:hypothetical protein
VAFQRNTHSHWNEDEIVFFFLNISWNNNSTKRTFRVHIILPGAKPTIVTYNASAVKKYNASAVKIYYAASSLARFESKYFPVR